MKTEITKTDAGLGPDAGSTRGVLGQPRRKHAYLSIIAALTALVFGAVALSAQEPSTDRKNPTPFTSNSIAGEYDGDATTHYFRFIAGKGDVKVSVTANTKAYSTLMDVELLDESGRSLEKFSVAANLSGRTEARTHTFIRRQPVIVKVFMRADTDIKHLKYEIELSGPVEFESGASAATGGTSATAATGATGAATQGERMCLPAAGTLVIQIASGESYEVDLAQVTKASVKP